MKNIKPIISLLILTGLIVALNTKFGDVPPLGKFLDPDGGFWANAVTGEFETDELQIEGLQEEVSIYYDDRGVPHIFAQNDHDLYMAQGYVVARDRLFQLELQTYDAAGRLTELVGESALSRDRGTRRLGMLYGAEKAIEYVMQDSLSKMIFEAYADGVNAWISSLDPKDYPLEYKILDAAPEPWKPIKSALLLKNMTRTLASGNNEDRTSNTMKYFGEEFVERFFTQRPEMTAPIIPPTREWDFEAEVPEAPEELYVPESAKEIEPYSTPEGIGSNNWVVHGSKTASGYPILANDPHLSLTLPSIWYEIQLHAPGINTYGVTLQGAPGVIIGYNEHVAWGVTNVGSDVMDWYEVQFRDESMKEYRYDGEWKETSIRVEEFYMPDGEVVKDTMVYTHHGPVTRVGSRINEDRAPAWHALRWIAHEPSNEIRAFYYLNRAGNYDDYVQALGYYDAPAQNFVFASQDNDIALWVNGKLPLKWDKQGRTVSDGSDPRYDWQGWIPREQNPHIKNPERGFVSSANQESAAEDYPYYLDDNFAAFERGRRINDLLSEMTGITKDDMQQMQMDTYNYHAATITKDLLEWVNTDSLDESEREVYDLMDNWDFMMDADKIAPAIFERWWSNFYASVIYDEFRKTQALLRYPPRDRFVEVIKSEPDFEFFDNINTEVTETREERALYSFRATIGAMTEDYGEMGDNWSWGRIIDLDIDHLANIPGMGAQNVVVSGSSKSINANNGGSGPSWRMVVELGPEVKGYGVYPGGPSGNPGSPLYDSMVETWRTGGLFELNFYKSEPTDYSYSISLKN